MSGYVRRSVPIIGERGTTNLLVVVQNIQHGRLEDGDANSVRKETKTVDETEAPVAHVDSVLGRGQARLDDLASNEGGHGSPDVGHLGTGPEEKRRQERRARTRKQVEDFEGVRSEADEVRRPELPQSSALDRVLFRQRRVFTNLQLPIPH